MKIIPLNRSQISISDCIREFIRSTGVPYELAAHILELTPSEFELWRERNTNLLKITSLDKISNYFGISNDSIISQSYDKETIRKKFIAHFDLIPPVYNENKFSRVRTSAHIIKYLTLTRGQHFSDYILKKLNVSPLIYDNLDNLISLKYFMDLLDILATEGFSQIELDSLAGMLFLGLNDTEIGNQFKKSQTNFDCYNILGENLTNFDENFDYSYDLDSSKFNLRAFLPYEKHFSTEISEQRIKRLHRYRLLLIGWFPYLSGLPPIIPKVEYKLNSNGILANYTVYFKGTSSKPIFLC